MDSVRARVVFGLAVGLVLPLAAALPAAGDPSTNHCCWDSWSMESAADVIDKGPNWGWNNYRLTWDVSGGPINGATTSLTLPGGLSDLWVNAPSNVSWAPATHTLTFTHLSPLLNGWSSLAVERIHQMDQQTPRLKATRSISNPIFTTDLETRTVTVTLDIAPGSLASDQFLSVDLATEWDLPQGLAITAVSKVIHPEGFGPDSDRLTSFSTTNSGGLGSFSGLYTFSADVTFQRSGALSQSAIGNLLFKCPASMSLSRMEWPPTTTGMSASLDLAPGVEATFASEQTVTFSPHAHKDGQEMKFDTIVAASGAPASVQQIFVGKGRRLTVTGGTTYSVTVNCESNNVVSGTVTTPGGAAYALVAGDRGPWSFGVSSDAPADLAGFGLGNYTIKVWGADGIDKTYVVPLGGELPSDAPTYNLGCWSTITDSRPTISWGASADPNVNKVHLDLWAGDKDYGSGFADPSQTSLTPSEDLPNGFAMACVVFIDGEEYTFPDGAKYLSGLYSCADLGFNVVVLPGDANGDGVVDASDYIILKQHMGATTGAGASDGDFDKDGTVNWTDLQILMANFGQTQGADMPEPATLSLLALGGLAMIRRRR